MQGLGGPKKVMDLLLKTHAIERPPNESTIALILSRHGLSQERKRRPGVLIIPLRPTFTGLEQMSRS